MTTKIRIVHTTEPNILPYYAQRFIGNEYSPDKWEKIYGAWADTAEKTKELAIKILKKEETVVGEYVI